MWPFHRKRLKNNISQPGAEPGREKPPEIMALSYYFTRVFPSYLYFGDERLDVAYNETDINWLSVQGNDVVRSISEYIAFKPDANLYNRSKLDWKAVCILLAYSKKKTFFIVDSRDSLPKEEQSFEMLKTVSIENSIRIVEKNHKASIMTTWKISIIV